MVAAIIISVVVVCITIVACVYMECARSVKVAKLDLKKAHTKCKHELALTQLEHDLKKELTEAVKNSNVPNKASETDTAAFFKILQNPTLLYDEEDGVNGTSRNS